MSKGTRYLVRYLVPSAAALLMLCGAGFSQENIRPKRVVSINLCADELLLRVADPGQVVGVTRLEKSPEAETLLTNSDMILKLRGDAEEVLALHPDLVLAGRYTDRETQSMLKRFNISVKVIEVPQNFSAIADNLRMLGQILGHEDRSQQMAYQMLERLEILKRHSLSSTRALFYQRGGHVPGAETFEDEILRAAGVKNLAAEMGIKSFGVMSIEDLILQKPDVLIFPTDQTQSISVERERMLHPALRERLPKLRILEVPSYMLNCGTPASVDAVEMIQNQL